MNANEIALMHLLIQRLENSAADYAQFAENFAEGRSAGFDEFAKRLVTSVECLKMDLLEEKLMTTDWKNDR